MTVTDGLHHARTRTTAAPLAQKKSTIIIYNFGDSSPLKKILVILIHPEIAFDPVIDHTIMYLDEAIEPFD